MHVHCIKHLLVLSVANFGRSEVFTALMLRRHNCELEECAKLHPIGEWNLRRNWAGLAAQQGQPPFFVAVRCTVPSHNDNGRLRNSLTFKSLT